MATITPTNQVSAATMAANWGPGVSNNAQKWQKKALNPRAAFNANPQQNQANWAAGVQRAQAQGTYATKLANVDLAAMANAIATYGTSNYAASGSQKAAKYAAKAPALAAALSAVAQTVSQMPTGKGANNEARVLAQMRGMAAYKGKI